MKNKATLRLQCALAIRLNIMNTPSSISSQSSHSFTARLALLYIAIYWGLSWLGFRYLYAWGMSGISVGVATAIIPTVLSLYLARGHIREGFRTVPKSQLIIIMVSAALSNLAFTWGVIHGQVMRVMLLFYLMPVWTGLLATLVYHERTNWAGWLGIVLGVVGASVMLYDPASGLPLPMNLAEWAGLIAGIGSAVMTVQVRHGVKMRADFQRVLFGLGPIVFGLIWLQFEPGSHWPQREHLFSALSIIVLMGCMLMLSYTLYQYGLKYLTSHQAVVIFPFELVVGAVSSALIAHEMMSMRAWIGGGLIVLASFIASWWGVEDEPY